MSAPTVGLAIIARDEQDNLPRLLESIDGAFDRVVLLDTGSKDRTIRVFQAWAAEHPSMTWSIGHFEWCDDFAAARNAADKLLMQAPVDWLCWADCDDTIVNAGVLRDIAVNAAPQVGQMIFGYDYAQHPETGECICHLKRERLVRAGAGHWHGRVHECQLVEGAVTMVPDDVCHWRHHKQGTLESAGASNARNLRILRAWVKEAPEDPRVLAYLGTELAIQMKPGKLRQAVGYFKRYMKLRTTWDEERAQVGRKLSLALLHLDRVEEAQTVALDAVAVRPDWPDSYITLGEVALSRGEPGKTLIHADRAISLGVPDTLLIINPLDYLSHPHRLLAGAYGLLEQWDRAAEECKVVLAHEPSDTGIRNEYEGFRAQARRDHTAETVVMVAQQLVAHDEQEKALRFLEDCIIHFATDHPAVVAARSELRERLAWTRTADAFTDHYQTGGSKPEDFHGDEMIEPIGDALPRVKFLLDGLTEQMAA